LETTIKGFKSTYCILNDQKTKWQPSQEITSISNGVEDLLWKENLNSDDQHFHQYYQNKTIESYINTLNETKNYNKWQVMAWESKKTWQGYACTFLEAEGWEGISNYMISCKKWGTFRVLIFVSNVWAIVPISWGHTHRKPSLLPGSISDALIWHHLGSLLKLVMFQNYW
jgi:hypothetical protein